MSTAVLTVIVSHMICLSYCLSYLPNTLVTYNQALVHEDPFDYGIVTMLKLISLVFRWSGDPHVLL